MSKIRQIEVSAYHEAGHCVAACLVHKRFRLVTIIPEKEYLGKFVPDKMARMDIASADIKSCKAWIFIGLAGLFAESKFVNPNKINKLPPSHPDLDTVTNIADRLCWSFEERNAYLKFMWIRTKNIIEKYWKAVQAVAQVLINRKILHYKETQQIIKKALGYDIIPQIYFF